MSLNGEEQFLRSLLKSWVNGFREALLAVVVLGHDLSLPSVWRKVGLVLPSFLLALPDGTGDLTKGTVTKGKGQVISVQLLTQKEQRCHWAVTHISVHWHEAPWIDSKVINRAELAQWARGIKGRELPLSQSHGYICQREACSRRTREGAETGSISRVKSSGYSVCPHGYHR